MTTARTRVREELSARLVPALQDMGFKGPSGIMGNTPVHEFRRKSDSGTHVVSIQLEKRGLPRFVLNLHVEPPKGMQSIISRGGTVMSGQL